MFFYNEIWIPSDWSEINNFTTTEYVYSVSINSSGDTVAAGLVLNTDRLGKVLIGSQLGSTWTTQELSASTGGLSGLFGRSVLLNRNGNLLFVGSPGANKVFVFQRSGSTWSEAQILTGGAGFGSSLSLVGFDEMTLAVGSPHPHTGGSVSLFGLVDSTWTEVQTLTASVNYDYGLGTSVSFNFNGSVLAIGAVQNPGAAYIFKSGSQGYYESQRITSSFSDSYGQYFGTSISISADGNLLLVGEPGKRDTAPPLDPGTAYLFQDSNEGFREIQAITSSISQQADYFGYSVFISSDGNVLVIGSPHSSVEGVSSVGAAHTFERSGSTWNETQILTESSKRQFGQFGQAISATPDARVIVTSAPAPQSLSGSVYILEGT